MKNSSRQKNSIIDLKTNDFWGQLSDQQDKQVNPAECTSEIINAFFAAEKFKAES